MTKPCDLSAVEARQLIGRKSLSPVELVESNIARIGEVDGALNAITAIDEDGARAAARDAEQAVMDGEPLGLLHGLPVGVKDLQATKGLRTTWGSLLYEHTVPDEDDPMVANVRAEGGIILAKTNTPEFGAGANTTNLVFGATGNPFDQDKTCGGSSGGSGVAVATGMVPLATGSDHGGSLRTPASFCGVVGFRSSPGIIPRKRPASMLPMSVNGPMARTVEDMHLLLQAQIDVDRDDPYSSDDVMRIPDVLSGIDLGSLKVAFSADLGCAPIDHDIRKVFEGRTKHIGSFFAEVQTRDPDFTDMHEAFEILRSLQFVASHKERLENSRDLLGPNVISNTEQGLKYSLSDVAWAHKVQTAIFTSFRAFFNDTDILICPGAGISPFPHAQLFLDEINGEKMPNYIRWFAMTYALTIALPAAVCLPCGVDHLGMPFGIQIVGPYGSDAYVLEVAFALEQALAANKETARPEPDLMTLQGSGK